MHFDDQQEETAVQIYLEELAHEIHSCAGVRMHRLNVCEWEVKLWISSSGQANGSWRIVVTNVTGHTCTVHVSLNIENLFLKPFHKDVFINLHVAVYFITLILM